MEKRRRRRVRHNQAAKNTRFQEELAHSRLKKEAGCASCLFFFRFCLCAQLTCARLLSFLELLNPIIEPYAIERAISIEFSKELAVSHKELHFDSLIR